MRFDATNYIAFRRLGNGLWRINILLINGGHKYGKYCHRAATNDKQTLQIYWFQIRGENEGLIAKTHLKSCHNP